MVAARLQAEADEEEWEASLPPGREEIVSALNVEIQ
jgi:hypothetical protein